MTDPKPDTVDPADSSSTGRTDGTTGAWRYWHIHGGRLQSPFAGDVLPTTGVLHAECRRRPHLPPSPGCECGVSIYLSADDVARAVELLDMAQFAVTYGSAHRPLMRDTVAQLYTYAGMPRSGPPAYRCRAYQAHIIYTDTTINLDYELPVEAMSSLR